MNNTACKQIERWHKIISELKKNGKLEVSELRDKLAKYDNIGATGKYGVSSKTLKRDIKALNEKYREKHGADKPPLISYIPDLHKWELTNKEWDFDLPIQETDLSMFLLGLQLALDVIPKPISEKIESDIESLLNSGENSVEKLSDAMVDSFISSSGTKTEIDPDIFRKVFAAWKNCQTIAFSCRHPDGKVSHHMFEPHIIAFFKGTWYIKGYEIAHGGRQVECHALQRLFDIKNKGCFDVKDRKLILRTKRYGIFETPRIDGIKLRCDASMAMGLKEQQKARKYKMETQDDGSVILTMKPEAEISVLRWVLSEGGKIEVLYPDELRRKVAQAGGRLFKTNS